MLQSNLQTPTALAAVFASGGPFNTLPIQPTGSGAASQIEGFPKLTMPDNPGDPTAVPPSGEDMNGFLNAIGSHLFNVQNGFFYTFNQSVSDLIGGYPNGTILIYNMSGGQPFFVQSIRDNNNVNFYTNPSSIGDGVNWQKISITNTDFINGLKTKVDLASGVSQSNVDYIVYRSPAGVYPTYFIYKSGMVWQGGATSGVVTSLTFPVPMANNNYDWFSQWQGTNVSFNFSYTTVGVAGTTGFTSLLRSVTTAQNANAYTNWESGTRWFCYGKANPNWLQANIPGF